MSSPPTSGTPRYTLGIKIDAPLQGEDGLELSSGVETPVGKPSLSDRYLQHPRDRLSPEKLDMLEKCEHLARVMDDLVPIPGTRRRAGLDALIGLVPLAGDLVCMLISLSIVVMAWRLGARPKQVARMVGNLTLDLLIGIVPLVGDIFDVMFQANLRNVDMLKNEVLGFAAVPVLEGTHAAAPHTAQATLPAREPRLAEEEAPVAASAATDEVESPSVAAAEVR